MLPNIDARITAFLIYITNWQIKFTPFGLKVVRNSPCHCLHRYYCDKINYISNLNFVLLHVKKLKVKNSAGNLQKKVCESKNFQWIQTSR